MLSITIRRTKLFYDGGAGEAPAGTTREFDLMQHRAFLAQYGHCHINSLMRYARETVAKWNRQQPHNWKYELIG